MRKIRCVGHGIEFQIPTTEEEFLSGKLHEDVIHIQKHIEDFPQCTTKVKKT